MRHGIADLTMRAARAVGGSIREPRDSLLAVGVFRVAGWVIAACGGRLESRIMSFVVSDRSDDEVAAGRTLGAIQETLAARGMSPRVNETRLSRDAALHSEDVRPLVPEDTSSMIFYEIYVPTHCYWKASTLVDGVLRELNESRAG